MTTRHTPPTDTRASGYLEAEVDAWIHARIKGERWAPGAIPNHPTIIRPKEAQRRTGLSNFSLWSAEQAGTFPKRFRLTDAPRRVPADAPDASGRVPHRVGFMRRSVAQPAE
jgi:predicted DNA-binding transcriptional regulator AlpA